MKTESARFELCAGLGSQLPPADVPEIALVDRSNVGKSSLINRLLQRKALARTSNTPGKTATINFYRCDTLRLVDLPGYGYAKVSGAERQRWDELIQAYFDGKRPLALVLQLLDVRHPITRDDETMLRYLTESGLPFSIVLTKTDKLNKTQLEQQKAYFLQQAAVYPGVKVFPFSALSGAGAEEIRAQVVAAAEQDT